MSVKRKKIRKRGRPKRSENLLDSSAIVECAKKLIHRDGKVPSIRGIATALDVDPMAIYHYFANKNAMLEAVTVSLVDDVYEPLGENRWQVELKLLCKSYLELLTDYVGLLETLLTMSSEGPAAVFAQRFQMTLAPLDLDEQTLKDSLELLADYLHGFALAMHCNPEHKRLTVDSMDGPIRIYIRAIASVAPR